MILDVGFLLRGPKGWPGQGALLVLASVWLSAAWAAPLRRNPPCRRHLGNIAMENYGLFEGDILLPGNMTDRTAVTSDTALWPDGVIPFVVESSLGRNIAAIEDAMKGIESQTCLRFVPRTTERDYITLFKGPGCYSAVGRMGNAQPLSLGDGCVFRGTIIHELLHAVGFYHEHSRSDRDQYINVFLQNVDPRSVSQFQRLEPWQNRLISPFDYDSVMLYGSSAFARGPGLSTMLAKDGARLAEVFDKKDMDASDARRVNVLYHCSLNGKSNTKNKKTRPSLS
ncbi:astacin-like metalloprotease toxin 5 [Ixodes scapularis]|uniref:astacin-like metalloprotease toxin 5 n=1 Tax=Ixodes scapularis TaxID=6945 RepID=UPI001A9F94B3|nr:astacin-like metalloprotease toxin 5 [Ixodes scapularis]